MALFGSKQSVAFRIPEMNCGHCEAKVSGAVKGLAGVKKVTATSADKRLVVEYKGDTAPDLDAINNVLKPVGYEAEPFA
ncbi:MAG: copper chaperone [Spirochaetaceae bacterium]|nr:MAG: copper chaperone [Spirochaetaceae bacterium]